MRLINTRTLELQEFFGTEIPEYAALSHTWILGKEVSYKEMTTLDPTCRAKEGYQKILNTCAIAAREKIEYAWIDTCCIDKSSSAELSEAINSMYNWYRRCKACYAYLPDLRPDDPGTSKHEALKRCRWFKRGWTLQELIAPKQLVFYDGNWKPYGTKESLVEDLSAITRISQNILTGEEELSSVSVAQKMSWAAGRKTTRIEDTAYCLLGIFETNMPLLYGEEGRAFRRLQEQILLTVHDLSVFAWKRPDSLPRDESERVYCGVLADSPALFAECGSYIKKSPYIRQQIHAANGGITTRVQLLIELVRETGGYRYILPLDCSTDPSANKTLAVRLRKYGPNEFVRESPWEVWEWEEETLYRANIQKDRHLLAEIDKLVKADPDRPGRPGTHYFVGQHRSHALQINLPPDMWHHLFHVWPGHRFDGEDQVFFLTGDDDYDSAMIRLRGRVPPAPGPVSPGSGGRVAPTSSSGERHTDIDFECMFCAVGWSSTEESSVQCSILDYREYSTALAEFRKDVSGWDFNRRQYMKHLKHHGIPKASAVVIQIPDTGRTVRVSFKLIPVEDTTVCRNRFWKVEFTCVFEGAVDEIWEMENSLRRKSVL